MLHKHQKLERLRFVFEVCDSTDAHILTVQDVEFAVSLLGLDQDDIGLTREDVAWAFAFNGWEPSTDRVTWSEFVALIDQMVLRVEFVRAASSLHTPILAPSRGVSLLRDLGYTDVSLHTLVEGGALLPISHQDDGSVDVDIGVGLEGMLLLVGYANGVQGVNGDPEKVYIGGRKGAQSVGGGALPVVGLPHHSLSSSSTNDFIPDLPPLSPGGKSVHSNMWKFLAAGAAAGMVSKTVTAPFERIKVLQQTADGKVRTWAVISDVVRSSGLRGLLRGNAANLLQIVPFAALVCAVYSPLVRAQPLRPGADPHAPWPAWRMASGAVAGVVATCVTYPMDVVRGHMSIQGLENSPTEVYDKTVSSAFRRIVDSRGVSGLYRGLVPTLGSIAPFVGIQMAFYDVLKAYGASRFPRIQDKKRYATPYYLSCGVLAGIVATYATHPIDLVRRRLQLGSVGGFSYSSTRNAFGTILKTDGIPGLFRGVVPAALKVAPAVASGLVTRDAVLRYLEA